MKSYLLLAGISILFLGCGKDGKQGPPAEPYIAPSIKDSVQEDIDYIVNDENDYREGMALPPLTSGLSCKLQTFTSGHRIQPTSGGVQTLTGLSTVGTFLYKGKNGESFKQPNSSMNDGMNVLPDALRPLFKNMYTLDCTGYIVVLESGYYLFEIQSDDASLVYINNSLLIDNDNSHGIVSKSNQKYLRRGLHQFRVRYAQSGGGNQALILKADGQSINPRFYAH
jgi:hypothetical protein